GLCPAPPPLAGRCWRDATASGRLATRKAGLDVRDQLAAAGKSETSVTVKPHPGPSFDCEPSQTHSLEGGPDDLSSCPQPVEARHLDARRACGLVSRRPIEYDFWTGSATIGPRHRGRKGEGCTLGKCCLPLP